MPDQPEIQLEDIKVDPITGVMSPETLMKIAGQIKKASQAAVSVTTNQQLEIDRTQDHAQGEYFDRSSQTWRPMDTNTERAAKLAAEAASAPPVCPPLEGKSEAEVKRIVEAHVRDKDAYFARLHAMPTGSKMTRTEAAAYAGEIRRVLNESGHRV
jgi:hypothetical protein